MPLVRIDAFAVSLDGYGAGPDQGLDHPLGRGGEGLHQWFFPTRTFQGMYGKGEGTTGVDDRIAAASLANVGAWIMGRHMFAPSRGPWTDDGWRGWWGENPPFHTPVFVLTHHPRPPLAMEGGTTFHFVDATPHEALRLAQEAAGGLDVRIGGGATVVRDFLAAGLVDLLHVVVTPIVLGRGVRLWDGLEGFESAYGVESVTTPAGHTHLTFTRR
jgi:dihydrofolate reductase